MSVLDRWLKPAAGKSAPATSATLPEQICCHAAPELSPRDGAQLKAPNVAKRSKRVATEYYVENQSVTVNVANVADVAGSGDPCVRAREGESEPQQDLSPVAATGSLNPEVISPARWAEPAVAFDEPSFEDPCPERRGLLERRGAVFLHFCVECGRWGAYGYGAPPGRWYCRLHRPRAGEDPRNASHERRHQWPSRLTT
jgi:hypothetical protein